MNANVSRNIGRKTHRKDRSQMLAGLALAVSLIATMASPIYAAFVPPAGLELWLKADAITGVNDGSVVSNWVDSTGLGGGRDMIQTNAANQPLYHTAVQTGVRLNNPVVRFDGVDDVMANAALHNAQTIIYVAKSTANEGVPYSRLGTVNEYFGFINGVGTADADLFLKNPQTYWVDSAPLAFNSFHVYSGLYQDPANGNNGSIYFDGLLVATGGGGDSPVNLADVVGARGNMPGPSFGVYFKGDFAEVLVFSANLSATERKAVEDYLTYKYLVWKPTGTVIKIK